jgi:hypothetical protein
MTPAETTLTPAELRTLLDLLATAEVKLGVAYNLYPILARAATLASGDRPIGGVDFPAPNLCPATNPAPPWAE